MAGRAPKKVIHSFFFENSSQTIEVSFAFLIDFLIFEMNEKIDQVIQGLVG
jgi:hypothetical protein